MKTYISGKITGLTSKEVKKNFNEAEELLNSWGMSPVNPLKNGLCRSECWERHMIRDIEMLMECDAILLLDNWIDSKGARIEKYIAEEKGMIILSEKGMHEIKGVEDAIHKVMGLKFPDYTKPGEKKRNHYYARLIYVKHIYKYYSIEDIAKTLNRSPSTLRPYLNIFAKEFKYNTEFRVLASKIEAIISKSVSQ